MKKYIDAQLQVVRINKSDVIATSIKVSSTALEENGVIYGADRFRDWDD